MEFLPIFDKSSKYKIMSREIPTRPKFLRDLVTPRLYRILNNLYEPGENLESNYMGDNHKLPYIETEGDLEDIIKLNCHIMDDAYPMTYLRAERTLRFIKHSEGMLTPKEMDNLEALEYFIRNYPNLYMTLKTWVYG